MNELNTKIIDFFKYCPECEHYPDDETKDPCNLCLSIPTQEGSQKPVYFKEKK